MAIKYNVFVNHANRGMALEDDINITNKYYLDNDIAIIYKKPTPIKVTKVAFNGKNPIIKEGFYEMPSTTDYNGIYKSKYIDFDAKEVKGKNYFDLSNLHKHQLDHLIKIYNHGGISFIIVRFCFLNTTYLLETNKIMDFLNNENRKSIPINFFEIHGHKIKESYLPRLDYVKVIDELYFNDKENV